MATRRISSRRRMSVNDVRTRLMQIHGGPPPGPQLAPVAAASRAQVAAEGWGRLGVLSPGAANAGAFFRRYATGPPPVRALLENLRQRGGNNPGQQREKNAGKYPNGEKSRAQD
jgi:hypothetical protein